MWALAGNDLAALSPEQIVDCDTVDQGCNGGDTPTAFAYVTQAGGLESDAAYPYTAGSGESGTCTFDESQVVAKINNFTWVIPECLDSCDSQDMGTVQSKLATVAPFAICVYAEPWQDYSGGIFNDQSCSHDAPSLDHCVQLVGYDNGDGYWLVRNSWAADWGENGYIRVSTKEAKGNLCGILDEVNYANAVSHKHKKH
jgi:C1A family cysteine protease